MPVCTLFPVAHPVQGRHFAAGDQCKDDRSGGFRMWTVEQCECDAEPVTWQTLDHRFLWNLEVASSQCWCITVDIVITVCYSPRFNYINWISECICMPFLASSYLQDYNECCTPPQQKKTPKKRECTEHSVGTQLVPSQGGTWVTTTQLVALVVSSQRIRCQCLRLAMDTSTTAPGKMMLAYLHFVFYECKGS